MDGSVYGWRGYMGGGVYRLRVYGWRVVWMEWCMGGGIYGWKGGGMDCVPVLSAHCVLCTGEVVVIGNSSADLTCRSVSCTNPCFHSNPVLHGKHSARLSLIQQTVPWADVTCVRSKHSDTV